MARMTERRIQVDVRTDEDDGSMTIITWRVTADPGELLAEFAARFGEPAVESSYPAEILTDAQVEAMMRTPGVIIMERDR